MTKCALQEYLKKTGKSIRGTALEIGLDPQMFNAYAHGKRPNQRNALRIAKGLGMAARLAEGAGREEVDIWEASPVRIATPPDQDAILLLESLYAPGDVLFMGDRYPSDYKCL